MARKFALVIGNSHYDDPGLGRLKAPEADVEALESVLKAPEIGQFDDVITLRDQGFAAVRRAIARFYDQRQRDDLLFFYFSGHGIKDEQGHLYLALCDTELAVLAGTAVETAFISARMDRSFSKRQVVMLDCCHSGAFAQGTKSAQGASVGTAEAFEGTGLGRVIVTATDATQYAWEGDEITGNDTHNSLFTHFLIEGLKTGAADQDADGIVTVDELYNYVRDQVVSTSPRQTPLKWTYRQQGDIVLAQNPFTARSALPTTLVEAIANKLPSARLEAVKELAGLLRGDDPQLARAALATLKEMSQDDSRKVAAAVTEALKTYEADRRVRTYEEPASPPPIVPPPERARRPPTPPEKIVERSETRASDVFISYAHEDRETARALAGVLKGYGWKVWWDRKIAPGESFDLVIERELRTCKCAIVLWSERSVVATWVRNEARRAARRQVLVPILINAVEPPLEFDNLQAADLTSWEAPASHPELETVIDRVRELAPIPHDLLARAAVEAAWQLFASGDHQGAINRLATFRPEHAAVTAGLDELRAELKRIEDIKIETARRDAEAEREKALEAARWRIEEMLESGDLAAAATALNAAESEFGGPAFAQLRDELAQLETKRAEALRQEQAAARARALEAEVQRIDALLDGGELDTVDQALSAAEAEFGEPAFVAVRDRWHARRAQAELNARAEQVVAAAREQFAGGDHDGALASLESFEPEHEMVLAALAELRADKQRIDEERAEQARREAARQRALDVEHGRIEALLERGELAAVRLALSEAEQEFGEDAFATLWQQWRIRQTQADEDARAQQLVDVARRQFAKGDHQSAIERLEAAFQPDHPTIAAALIELRAEAQRIADERAEQERREKEAAERKALDVEHRRVAAMLDRGQLEKAAPALADAEARFGEEPFATLRRRFAQATENARAQEAIVAAKELFANGEQQAAMTHLEEFSPEHPRVSAALNELRAEAQRIADELAERVRQEEEARNRTAHEAIEMARRRFADGEHQTAIAALAAFRPEHPDVTAALDGLRADAKRISDERAEAARLQKEAAIRETCARIDGLLNCGELEAAEKALDAAEADFGVRALASPRLQWRKQQTQAAEDRRASDAVAAARQQFAAGNHQPAIDSLAAFRPRHTAVTAALTELRADATRLAEERAEAVRRQQEKEAAERQAREAVESAHKQFATGAHQKAIASLDAYRPAHEVVTSALTAMRADLKRIEDERAEQLRQEREAKRLQAEARRRQEEAGQRALEAGCRRIEAMLDRGELDEAERALTAAEAQFGKAAFETLRLKQQTHVEDERARRVIDAARQQFAAGEHEAALTALAAFEPSHFLVTAAHAQLRTEAKRLREKTEAERVAAEAKRQREAEAERVAAEGKRQREAEAERVAAEAKRQRAVEAERVAAEAKRAEAEAQRVAKEAEDRKRAEREAEDKKRREKAEAERLERIRKQERAEAAAAAAAGAATGRAQREPDVVATPQRSRALYLAGGAAALFILLLAGWLLTRGAPDATTSAVNDPKGAGKSDDGQLIPAPAGTGGTGGTSPTPVEQPPDVKRPDPPPEPTPEPTVKPPATRPELDTYRTIATNQLKAGRREQALNAAIAGLRIDPKDPALNQVVSELLRAAQVASDQAKQEALTVGRGLRPVPGYAEGLKNEAAAGTHRGAGRNDAATQSYWAAANAFTRATDEFKQQAAEAERNRQEQTRLAQLAEQEKQKQAAVAAAAAAAARPPDTTEARNSATPTPPARNAAAPARTVTDEERIRQLLSDYSTAYEQMNVDAIVAMQPAQSRRQLEDAFKNVSSYSMNIRIATITTSGNTAVVTGTVETDVRMKTGNAPKGSRGITLRLEKNGTSWVIRERR